MQDNIITSYNFARKADIVFAESTTVDQFKKLHLDNYTIFNKDSERILYRLNETSISENDVIFCHTDFIEHLFFLIEDVEFTNIKLLTNQTDTLINKKIFSMKPKCISQWFSVNVGYKNDNLIPIPLGLANDYKKNLTFNEIKSKNQKKENFLYLNFRENTSIKYRKNLYNFFQKYDWTIVKSPNLVNSQYSSDLNRYKFILCPWGNGIDSHRIWEALYSGSIAVTEQHYTFNTFSSLPIYSYKSYKDLSMKDLLEFEKASFNISKKQLDLHWWLNIINENKIKNNMGKIRVHKDLSNKDILLARKQVFQSRLKKIKYYLRKLQIF